MPSWHDGSSSSNDVLGDITDLDLAPDTVDDPTFFGIALDCPEVCGVHKLKPRRCVAFQGTNIGRTFYLCLVPNQVEICGFVSWIDGEWPETAQNAIGRLWAMYNDSKSARIDEKYDHAKFVHDLGEEKNKIENKYPSLVEDINKYFDDTHKRVMQENYAKIMNEGSDNEKQVVLEKERDLLKNKVEVLEKEIGELKQVQRSQADVMKVKQKKWDAKKLGMKEEKKKLEYIIYEMVNASQTFKDKLKRIREICDE